MQAASFDLAELETKPAMALSVQRMHKAIVRWFMAAIAGVALQSAAAIAAAHITKAKIDQAVIAGLPVWHGNRAQVLVHLDLSQPFATRSQWTLVVAQDPGPPAVPMIADQGPLAICFVDALSPRCSETYKQHDHAGVIRWLSTMYSLRTAKMVYAGHGETDPLLLLQICSTSGINGNCDIRTVLYEYDKQGDRFRQVFVNDTDGSNNNQATRFVEYGPLQGDVIVDYPTGHAPYTYWIEVYAPRKSGEYTRILRYRGYTGYDDGNPLAVADSEMPEILRRLGLWRPGDALPIPLQRPKGCTRLVMRHGEEWCR